MQIFKNPNYDFIKWRMHAVVISLLFIGAGLVTYLVRGLNIGIDFAGGVNIVLKFREDVPITQLRSALPHATIQQYGPAAERSVLIRLPKQETEGDYAGSVVGALHKQLSPEASTKHDLNYYGSDQLTTILQQADPDNRGTQPAAADYYRAIAKRIIEKRSELGIFTSMNQVTEGVSTGAGRVLQERTFLGRFNVLNQETVGPQVGSQLQRKALLAIVLSSLAMGLYIWLRFDFVFGVSAMVCIIHDTFVVMAFLIMARLEFSLNVVAAILTLVGYSINDTVVLYDRVRENKRKIKKPMSLGEHLNLAMNQTLSRTVLTSGTVFLVLLAMLIFGGEVIRGFSWILTVGVISGTYSTLFIVPAVAVAWDKWKGGKNGSRPPAIPARVEAVREDLSRKRKAS